MLKKRIYLPDKCKTKQCPYYNELTTACKKCPIYTASTKERATRLAKSHQQAAQRYYHKQKLKKVKIVT